MQRERRSQLLSEFLVAHRPGVVSYLEENIVLPRKFSPRQPGRFSTAQRPYMRTILENFHPESGVNDVVVAAGTQLLKTTVLCLGLGYRIVNDPLPALIVLPTSEFARDVFSKRRLQPLIDDNPQLAACKPLNPDDYKHLSMEMIGGEISIVGSNSPAQLSGRPVGMVLQDEVCKFEHHQSEENPEAHPCQLADERTKDFDVLAFRYKSSSPNVRSHPFWTEFELGSQTRFYVPCPECGEFFPFEFTEKKEDDYRSVVWDQDAKDSEGLWIKDAVRESAKYVCPFCRYQISNHEKPAMLEACEAKDEHPSAPGNHKSYQIPSFYSPRITFGDMAVQFLKGMSQILGLQNFYNSWLAECWEEIEVRVKDAEVKALRATGNEAYRRGVIPWSDVAYLVMTADPGMRETHWLVSAVKQDTREIAVIDWGTVLTPEDLLAEARNRTYTIGPTGATMSCTLGLTDSLYLTERVYRMCYASGGFWRPTQGSDAPIGTWNSQAIRTFPGMEVLIFVDHTLKTELYAKKIAELGAPRLWLPADASEGLMGQLSGQELVAPKGTTKSARWKRVPHDHWGDCLKQVLLAEWVWNAQQALLHRLTPKGEESPEVDTAETAVS